MSEILRQHSAVRSGVCRLSYLGHEITSPMKSFLRQYNLSGKTVIPFNTNGEYGIGSTFQTVKELCPSSNVLEGFTMRGGSERDGQLLVIQGEKATEAETAVNN